jgi:hypothetical protein
MSAPLPIGTQVLFIAPDGRVHLGEVVAHRVIQIRSMPGLGRQYKCLVLHKGKRLIPPMIARESDHIRCKELHRESWLLLEGVTK